MKRAIVVGSGAGGATAAKELQGAFDITVLEAGKEFRRFSMSLKTAENLKKIGLLFDEREIELLFPAMKIQKTEDRMVLVRGIATGGTTTLATGNALRMDHDLKKLGINLDPEFEELSNEIPITTDHQNKWRKTTRRLYEIFQEMNLNPMPMPKMGDYERCASCGRCVLGCPSGVKWDSRQFLRAALEKGARLATSSKVDKVVIQDGKATGVIAKKGLRSEFFPADLVILAAGGLGTPVILENSGITCEKRLFVDPVLCVAAEWKEAFQNQEIPMPFVARRDRYILSPYFDHLSFFFNKKWRFPAENILSLMVKLADSNSGSVSKRKTDKTLTEEDKERLKEAVEVCTQILRRMGAKKENIFLGTINAGHPGGMLPLTAAEAETFHPSRLPENLYIADATLFPKSLGNPPILTIMAMAKRVSKVCLRNCF